MEILKIRLKGAGNELVANCNQLKMVSPKDGKNYNTDVVNTKKLPRIIQSVPSKNLRSKILTSSLDNSYGGRRYLTKVFTE